MYTLWYACCCAASKHSVTSRPLSRASKILNLASQNAKVTDSQLHSEKPRPVALDANSCELSPGQLLARERHAKRKCSLWLDLQTDFSVKRRKNCDSREAVNKPQLLVENIPTRTVIESKVSNIHGEYCCSILMEFTYTCI